MAGKVIEKNIELGYIPYSLWQDSLGIVTFLTTTMRQAQEHEGGEGIERERRRRKKLLLLL